MPNFSFGEVRCAPEGAGDPAVRDPALDEVLVSEGKPVVDEGDALVIGHEVAFVPVHVADEDVEESRVGELSPHVPSIEHLGSAGLAEVSEGSAGSPSR